MNKDIIKISFISLIACAVILIMPRNTFAATFYHWTAYGSHYNQSSSDFWTTANSGVTGGAVYFTCPNNADLTVSNYSNIDFINYTSGHIVEYYGTVTPVGFANGFASNFAEYYDPNVYLDTVSFFGMNTVTACGDTITIANSPIPPPVSYSLPVMEFPKQGDVIALPGKWVFSVTPPNDIVLTGAGVKVGAFSGVPFAIDPLVMTNDILMSASNTDYFYIDNKSIKQVTSTTEFYLTPYYDTLSGGEVDGSEVSFDINPFVSTNSAGTQMLNASSSAKGNVINGTTGSGIGNGGLPTTGGVPVVNSSSTKPGDSNGQGAGECAAPSTFPSGDDIPYAGCVLVQAVVYPTPFIKDGTVKAFNDFKAQPPLSWFFDLQGVVTKSLAEATSSGDNTLLWDTTTTSMGETKFILLSSSTLSNVIGEQAKEAWFTIYDYLLAILFGVLCMASIVAVVKKK